MSVAIIDEFDLEAFAEEAGLTDESDKPNKGMKSLREALKKAKDESKAQAEELAKYRGQDRAQSVKEAFKAKGIEEDKLALFAKLYPSDSEANDESVTNWLTEFGPAFGLKTVEKVDQDTVTQMQRVSDAGNNAPESSTQAGALAALKAAKTPAELDTAMRAIGMKK